jgi:hypothetical protein
VILVESGFIEYGDFHLCSPSFSWSAALRTAGSASGLDRHLAALLPFRIEISATARLARQDRR